MDPAETTERHAAIQEEVQESAEILARQRGTTVTEVWNEALTLHRVRYETEIVPPPGEEPAQPRY